MNFRKRSCRFLILACTILLSLVCAPVFTEQMAQKGRSDEVHVVKQTRLWLFNTFWLPDKTITHQQEVELAFLLNVANKDIHTIYFAFERPHGDMGCEHLLRHLAELVRAKAVQDSAQIRCSAYAKQPTYLDMFHLALAQVPSRDVAIIANADMVFDESIRRACQLRKNQVAVLATSGLSEAPKSVHDFYRRHFIHNIEDLESLAPSRCYEPPTERTSWDAFIFHPTDINLIDNAFIDEATGLPFFMNQHGAENAALHALLLSSRRLHAIQACDFIKMWHLHTAPKTHFNDSDAFITAPAAAPRYGFVHRCDSFASCDNHSLV